MVKRRTATLAILLGLAAVSAATAAVIQQGDLRIMVLAQVNPYKLFRTAPPP